MCLKPNLKFHNFYEANLWKDSIFIFIRGDGNFLKARQEAKKGELDEQLREYINEWRKQRSKEEEELHRLKEKQAKRKEIRAEQEKKLAQQKKEEHEQEEEDMVITEVPLHWAFSVKPIIADVFRIYWQFIWFN